MIISFLIFLGIVLAILTYILYACRSFNILENIGSEGTLLEWLIVLCPIVHMVFALRHRKLTADFKTIWECISFKNIKKQYNTIKKNIKKFEDKY